MTMALHISSWCGSTNLPCVEELLDASYDMLDVFKTKVENNFLPLMLGGDCVCMDARHIHSSESRTASILKISRTQCFMITLYTMDLIHNDVTNVRKAGQREMVSAEQMPRHRN